MEEGIFQTENMTHTQFNTQIANKNTLHDYKKSVKILLTKGHTNCNVWKIPAFLSTVIRKRNTWKIPVQNIKYCEYSIK